MWLFCANKKLNFTKLNEVHWHNTRTVYPWSLLERVCYKQFSACTRLSIVMHFHCLLIVSRECKKPRSIMAEIIPDHFILEMHMSSFGNRCYWLGHLHSNEACFILEELSNNLFNSVQLKLNWVSYERISHISGSGCLERRLMSCS